MKENLRQWLLRYGFLDFQDGLMSCGVSGFEDLVLLTEEDLKELAKVLGLNLVMRRKFLNAIRNITTPQLESQQLVRKLQANSDELLNCVRNHCALVCSLAVKVAEHSRYARHAPTNKATSKEPMRRQASLKRSRSQHFFGQMDLDTIINSPPPLDTLSSKQQVFKKATASPNKLHLPQNTGMKSNDPAVKGTVKKAEPKKVTIPHGPKPPMVPVLALVPSQTKIKVYVEALSGEVTYVVTVTTPQGEEVLEFKEANEIQIPNIQAGRNYKVKVAAKSSNGVVGTWSEAEPVLIPLNRETIVIFGGDVEYEENLSITEYYNENDKKWVREKVMDMKSERTRLGACQWRGNLIVAGGSERGQGHTNKVAMYNVAQTRWEDFSDMKFVRHSHKIGVVDGKLFCLGGYGTRGTNNKRYRFLDVLEIYDSAQKMWLVHPERMHLPRKDFGMVVIDDEIFVAGGESNSRIVPDCEVFNFSSGKWMKIASMNTKRRQCGSCEFGGRFWIAGGFQGGSKKKAILSSSEMYDPHEDIWYQMPPLAEPRYGCSLQKMNDKLFCIGGYNTQHDPVNTIEVFDFESNCWRRWKSRIMKARGSHEAVVIEKWW